MKANYSLGPLGTIIKGTLKEVRKGEYELLVFHKEKVGKVYFDEKTYTVNYGIFLDDYFLLNGNMRAATDQAIWHSIKDMKG